MGSPLELAQVHFQEAHVDGKPCILDENVKSCVFGSTTQHTLYRTHWASTASHDTSFCMMSGVQCQRKPTWEGILQCSWGFEVRSHHEMTQSQSVGDQAISEPDHLLAL